MASTKTTPTEVATANDWPDTEASEGQATKRTFDEVQSPSKKTRTPKKKKGSVSTLPVDRLPLGTLVFDPDTPTRPRTGRTTLFPTATEPLSLGAKGPTEYGTKLAPKPPVPATTWAPPPNPPANASEEVSSLAGEMEGVTITQASDTASAFFANATAFGPNAANTTNGAQGPPSGDGEPDPFQSTPNLTAGSIAPPNLDMFTNVALANFPKVHLHRFMLKVPQETGTIANVQRGAVPPLVISWRFMDTRKFSEETVVPRRSDMMKIFQTLGANNVRAYPAEGWKSGPPHPLGTTKGVQPVVFVNSRIPADVHATATRIRYFNTPTYTYVFMYWEQGSSEYAFMLDNIAEVEASEGNVQDITESVQNAIRDNNEARQCLDAFHDTVKFEKKGVSYNQDTYLEALLKTVRAVGTQKDLRGRTEWSVHWDCPTADENGELLWITALRNIQITTPFGVVNRKQAPVVWCAICHYNCHSAAWCPFPNIPGWKMPTTAGGTTGGGGAPGGNRGGRGGGTRGRGRGRGTA